MSLNFALLAPQSSNAASSVPDSSSKNSSPLIVGSSPPTKLVDGLSPLSSSPGHPVTYTSAAASAMKHASGVAGSALGVIGRSLRHASSLAAQQFQDMNKSMPSHVSLGPINLGTAPPERHRSVLWKGFASLWRREPLSDGDSERKPHRKLSSSPSQAPDLPPSSHEDVSELFFMVGLIDGFQVWHVADDHTVNRVICHPDSGICYVKFLSPWRIDPAASSAVCLPETLPLIAVVCSEDEATSVFPASVVKLFDPDTAHYVHVLRFGRSVMSIETTTSALAVALREEVHVFSLEDGYPLRFRIPCFPGPRSSPGPAFALGAGMIALAGPSTLPSPAGPVGGSGLGSMPALSLPSAVLSSSPASSPSVGPSQSPEANMAPMALAPDEQGTSISSLVSASSTALSAVGKDIATGLFTLGEIGRQHLGKYVAGQAYLASPDPEHEMTRSDTVGLPIDNTSKGERTAGGPSEGPANVTASRGIVVVRDLVTQRVVTQFTAHQSPIGAIAFDPSGLLLVTVPTDGTCAHVYQVVALPNNTEPRYVSRHIYRLFRGFSHASVRSVSFSSDSRWIVLCSSRGTVHTYAINVLGGEPSVETHGPASGTGFAAAPSQVLRTWSRTSYNPPVITLSVVHRLHAEMPQMRFPSPAGIHFIPSVCAFHRLADGPGSLSHGRISRGRSPALGVEYQERKCPDRLCVLTEDERLVIYSLTVASSKLPARRTEPAADIHADLKHEDVDQGGSTQVSSFEVHFDAVKRFNLSPLECNAALKDDNRRRLGLVPSKTPSETPGRPIQSSAEPTPHSQLPPPHPHVRSSGATPPSRSASFSAAIVVDDTYGDVASAVDDDLDDGAIPIQSGDTSLSAIQPARSEAIPVPLPAGVKERGGRSQGLSSQHSSWSSGTEFAELYDVDMPSSRRSSPMVHISPQDMSNASRALTQQSPVRAVAVEVPQEQKINRWISKAVLRSHELNDFEVPLWSNPQFSMHKRIHSPNPQAKERLLWKEPQVTSEPLSYDKYPSSPKPAPVSVTLSPEQHITLSSDASTHAQGTELDIAIALHYAVLRPSPWNLSDASDKPVVDSSSEAKRDATGQGWASGVVINFDYDAFAAPDPEESEDLDPAMPPKIEQSS